MILSPLLILLYSSFALILMRSYSRKYKNSNKQFRKLVANIVANIKKGNVKMEQLQTV